MEMTNEGYACVEEIVSYVEEMLRKIFVKTTPEVRAMQFKAARIMTEARRKRFRY